MNKLAALLVCASAGVAVYGVLTLPTWLCGAMNRSLLWRVRDRTFDARRRAQLPDSPVVEEFIAQVERFIVVVPRISALQVWWFRRQHAKLMSETDLGVWQKGLVGYDDETQRLFSQLQDEVGRIVLRQYMVGSWSGLLLSAWRHPRILREVLRRQRPGPVLPAEHWRECEAVVAVERFVPHVGNRREKDLIAASG